MEKVEDLQYTKILLISYRVCKIIFKLTNHFVVFLYLF